MNQPKGKVLAHIKPKSFNHPKTVRKVVMDFDLERINNKLLTRHENMCVREKNSYKGNWNLSHTRAVEKAFSNDWFVKAGLNIISNL